MDPLLRGLCEQQIDKKLSGREIQDIRDLVEVLDLPVTSKEDAALGMFLGTIYNQLGTQCMKMYDRLPERDEIHGYHLILKRRVQEIKEKIFRLNTSNISDVTTDEKTESVENTEDFALVIQKKTQELKKKKEAKTKKQKIDDSGSNLGSSKKPVPEVKFSFNSSSRKEPTRNILGIPIKNKKTVMMAKS